jgi:hypothetical protein
MMRLEKIASTKIKEYFHGPIKLNLEGLMGLPTLI